MRDLGEDVKVHEIEENLPSTKLVDAVENALINQSSLHASKVKHNVNEELRNNLRDPELDEFKGLRNFGENNLNPAVFDLGPMGLLNFYRDVRDGARQEFLIEAYDLSKSEYSVLLDEANDGLKTFGRNVREKKNEAQGGLFAETNAYMDSLPEEDLVIAYLEAVKNNDEYGRWASVESVKEFVSSFMEANFDKKMKMSAREINDFLSWNKYENGFLKSRSSDGSDFPQYQLRQDLDSDELYDVARESIEAELINNSSRCDVY